MTDLYPDLLIGRRVGALLAFLTMVLALPSAAQAGCRAHYVTSRTVLTAQPGELGLPYLEPGGPARQAPTAPSDREPRPCTGAFCSSSPAVPVSTEPVAPKGGTGEWAIEFNLPSPSDPGDSIAWELHRSLRPIHRSCSIFHPPRG